MINTRMYWVHAITPLHVGSGRGVGFIDLPIMREKVTGWPLVPGSAVKGVMREHFVRKNIDEDLIKAAFGKPDDDKGNKSNAGDRKSTRLNSSHTSSNLVCRLLLE